MKKLETEVVGMQYRLTQSTRGMMKRRIDKDGPMEVLLVREHDNPSDENAVKVVIRAGAYKGMHIGYLPRAVASVYGPALDKGTRVIKSANLWDIDVESGMGLVEITPMSTKKKARKTK